MAAFGWRHEAQQFERDLQERLKSFGLELALDKTQTIRFGQNVTDRRWARQTNAGRI